MHPKTESRSSSTNKVARFFANLGPGLITGAADDDPSGISTYSVAGAAFGYMPLWTAVFSFPLMVAVQLMCARLGMVTGHGLAGVVRRHYPHPILWGACALLVVANVFNIGADLGGMGDATAMLTGIRAIYWTPLYSLLIVSLLFFSSYRQIARIFKWLTLVLFAYVITAFLAQPDWLAIVRATFIPHLQWSKAFLATIVAILGTTISPYLFFWQASLEVEEQVARDAKSGKPPHAVTDKELRAARADVVTGMLFSNMVMFFIILTAAATLHAHGKTDIATAQEAAAALLPLAGKGAYLLFTLGIVGTGMLAVPILAGSAAYAISEAQAWRGSLESRPNLAPRFYAVVTVSMLAGLGLNFVGFDAVKMLFYAAVLNGVLAPPLIVLVTLATSNPKIMGARTSSPALRAFGWLTTVAMTVAIVGMAVTY